MRSAVIFAVLILLGAMPLQSSAQVSVPAVDLQCVNSLSNDSSEGAPLINIVDTLAGDHIDSATCTVSNPNSYNESIEIQVLADGLVVAAPGTIYLEPNGEVEFQVVVGADLYMQPTQRILEVKAIVVEANGAPPPNYAESQVSGIIDIGNYKDNGCVTAATGNHSSYSFTQWPFVSIETEYTNDTGHIIQSNITVELNHTAAPLHSENFALLTWMGCYDGVIFHRVIDEFMIQGGDFTQNSGTGGHAAKFFGYCDGTAANSASDCAETAYTIPDEADNGLVHEPYVLSMAKTNAPNTGGSQFFIVDKDCTPSHLDGVHTVFGKVIDGKTYVEAISQVTTMNGDKPVEDVTIIKATLWNITDTDGDGVPDDIDLFPNDENESEDSDGDGIGDNSDAFPDDSNETHDDDNDGVGNNSDAFPNDPDETHDDDDDGVGNNADDFPDNALMNNWASVYLTIGILLALLIAAGVIISRMKKDDNLPSTHTKSELEQLEEQINLLQQKKSELNSEIDPSEGLFNED